MVFKTKFGLIMISSAFALLLLLIPTNADQNDDNGDMKPADFWQHIRVKRSFTCNSITGDFLCAGWPGAWRCNCGSACYNNVCTCKRCI